MKTAKRAVFEKIDSGAHTLVYSAGNNNGGRKKEEKSAQCVRRYIINEGFAGKTGEFKKNETEDFYMCWYIKTNECDISF